MLLVFLKKYDLKFVLYQIPLGKLEYVNNIFETPEKLLPVLRELYFLLVHDEFNVRTF